VVGHEKVLCAQCISAPTATDEGNVLIGGATDVTQMVESEVRRVFEFIPFVLVVANFVPRELEKAEIAAKIDEGKKKRLMEVAVLYWIVQLRLLAYQGAQTIRVVEFLN